MPDNTKPTTEFHAASGIRTHNPCKRGASDPRLSPRGQWDRLSTHLPDVIRQTFSLPEYLNIFSKFFVLKTLVSSESEKWFSFVFHTRAWSSLPYVTTTFVFYLAYKRNDANYSSCQDSKRIIYTLHINFCKLHLLIHIVVLKTLSPSF